MWNTVGWVLIASAVVASIMEIIKGKKYKDKATFKQMTVWGVILSIMVSAITYFAFDLLGHTISIALYSILIFFIQKEMDMNYIRPKIKAYLEKKAEKL